MGMSRYSSLVDQKQFDTNFYHVLYVFVYAVFNHSLNGKLDNLIRNEFVLLIQEILTIL